MHTFPECRAKVSILHDIAKGLAYLHSYKLLMIHSDLTAKNVLLSSERVAKISDFSNSRIIDLTKHVAQSFGVQLMFLAQLSM